MRWAIGMAAHLEQHLPNWTIGWDWIFNRTHRPKPKSTLGIGVKIPAQPHLVQVWTLYVIEPFGIGMPDINLRPRNGPPLNGQHSTGEKRRLAGQPISQVCSIRQ